MTDYDKLEERRQMARSNYYAQLAMMGYDGGGNPLDMVHVVRCRDCKFFYGFNEECGCNGGYHSEDWFCADGERREDKT